MDISEPFKRHEGTALTSRRPARAVPDPGLTGRFLWLVLGWVFLHLIPEELIHVPGKRKLLLTPRVIRRTWGCLTPWTLLRRLDRDRSTSVRRARWSPRWTASLKLYG